MAKEIPPEHEIHRVGILCPVSQRVGLPLVIYRHLEADLRRHDASLDNQVATYLMIDPHSGFAPPE